jgi:murein DD-endopeptidase MepM/ murein hydrolase activator NlpD
MPQQTLDARVKPGHDNRGDDALSFLSICFLVACLLLGAAAPAAAGNLELDGKLTQGGLLFGTTEPDARVTLDGKAVRVAPDGRFVIGFHRDAPAEARLTVVHPDGGKDERRLAIAQRTYEIQRIDGLPQKMVTPPDDVLARIKRENEMIAKVRAFDRPEALFESGFAWPAQGIISGVYGSQRILNGEPRQPHYGVDIAAPVGTPVLAPADGVIVLAEKDLYYTGGTIMIDHGHGLTSTLMHMSSVDVAVGRRVRQGDPVGAIGATGRVTGPHLDWRMNWFESRIDPALLVPPMPAPEQAPEPAAGTADGG